MATAAAAQTYHCLPGAPTSPVQYHPSLLELIENAAAVVAAARSEWKNLALTAADYVGNFELQAVGHVVVPPTADYQKHLKIADPDPDPDPDLDQMNQGSPYWTAQTATKGCQSSSRCQHWTTDPAQPYYQYHHAGYFPDQRARNSEFHSGKTGSTWK